MSDGVRRLTINYDVCQEGVLKLQNTAERVNDLKNSMEKTVHRLAEDGLMDSESATTYIQEFDNEVKASIERLEGFFVAAESLMTQMCNIFEEADNNIANMIKSVN